MRTYLAATTLLGAWIAANDDAPPLEILASAVTAPVIFPFALAFNLYCEVFER
jgi:hypothetical protein